MKCKTKLLALLSSPILLGGGLSPLLFLNQCGNSPDDDNSPSNYVGDDTGSDWKGHTDDTVLTISIDNDHASITSASSYVAENLIIPDWIKSNGRVFPLTNIIEGAFYNCQHLTGELIIGNKVTTIGHSAFCNCSLDGVIMGNNVFNILSSVFYGCENLITSSPSNQYVNNKISCSNDDIYYLRNDDKYYCFGSYGNVCDSGDEPSGQLTLLSGTKVICGCSFYSCENLTGVLNIPSSVIGIASRAFDTCTTLSGALNIPNGVKYIGMYCFNLCSGFNGNLTIPSSVTNIDDGAFNGCYGLTGDLNIPSSVTNIGNSTFDGCCSLTGDLTIPNSVTNIGEGAFRNCVGFISTASYADKKISCSTDNVYYIMNGNKYYCLGDCKNVLPDGQAIPANTELTLRSGTILIGKAAFSSCSELVGNLNIPDTIVDIPYYAFYSCQNLTGTLTIPNTVTSIGNDAFCACKKLTGSLTIHNSVVEIGDNSFKQCGFTGNLSIGNNVKSIGEHAFEECFNFIGDLNIPSSVVEIGDNSFTRCGFTGNLSIGNNVKSIGWHAFAECSNFIGDLNIPSSVVEIGDNSFKQCGFTGNLSIGNNVKSIGEHAFEECSNFIGDLNIPSSVTNIDGGAFYNCSGFISATAYADKKISCSSDNVYYIKNDENYYCLGSVENVYESSDKPSGQLTLLPETKVICGDSFYNCSDLTGDLTIPSSVTNIGENAFSECVGIATVNISGSLEDIYPYAFYSCSNLSHITLTNFSGRPSWNCNEEWTVFSDVSASGTISVSGGWDASDALNFFINNLGLPSSGWNANIL
ncbi:MAG: leucine-rich repeat domain-containing protein [Mycoplasmataceae bacterium]|nr:leucine-rich repeat domain-containing protein [Mycoplasmataceae bacterium]